MARTAVLWAWTRTIRLDKELTHSGVYDGLDIVRNNVVGKHRVTTFAAMIVISYSRSTLLALSFDARVFTTSKFGICWEKNQA